LHAAYIQHTTHAHTQRSSFSGMFQYYNERVVCLDQIYLKSR
jgi:hypothetical protein